VHRPVDLGTEPLVGGRVVGSGRLLDEQPVDVDAKPIAGPSPRSSTATAPVFPPVMRSSSSPSAPWSRARSIHGPRSPSGIAMRSPGSYASGPMGEFVDTYRPDLVDERRRREELAPRGLRMTVKLSAETGEPIPDRFVHARHPLARPP